MPRESVFRPPPLWQRYEPHPHAVEIDPVVTGVSRTVGQQAAFGTTTTQTVPESAALGLTSVTTVPQTMLSESGLLRPVLQSMAIALDTRRPVPQSAAFPPDPRLLAQLAALGLAPAGSQTVPQTMQVAVDTRRAVPQAMALSPFVRTILQAMALSPAGTRAVVQTARLRLTGTATVPQSAAVGSGSDTQPGRAVPQSAVLKLRGSHKPPKVNNHDIPQSAALGTNQRDFPQAMAVAATAQRFLFQAMLTAASGTERTVNQAAALGAEASVRSVDQAAGFELTTAQTVAQEMALSTVAGRSARPVPAEAVFGTTTVQTVPQAMLTDAAGFGRSVLQDALFELTSARGVDQSAILFQAVHGTNTVPMGAVLEQTRTRAIGQRGIFGGTSTRIRGTVRVAVDPTKPSVSVGTEPAIALEV